jgi:hypothetical protein
MKSYKVTTSAKFGEIVDPSVINSSSSSVTETDVITSSTYLLQAGGVLVLYHFL